MTNLHDADALAHGLEVHHFHPRQLDASFRDVGFIAAVNGGTRRGRDTESVQRERARKSWSATRGEEWDGGRNAAAKSRAGDAR